MMIRFITNTMDDEAVVEAARLISEALRLAVAAARESNPSERRSIEERALSHLRTAHRLERGHR